MSVSLIALFSRMRIFERKLSISPFSSYTDRCSSRWLSYMARSSFRSVSLSVTQPDQCSGSCIHIV